MTEAKNASLLIPDQLVRLGAISTAFCAALACSGEVGKDDAAPPVAPATYEPMPTAQQPQVVETGSPLPEVPGMESPTAAIPSMADVPVPVPGDPVPSPGPSVSGDPTLPGNEVVPDVPVVPQLDTGRTVLRRLTKPEYDNTVQDLLLTAASPASNFTAADTVAEEGFDTIGAVLTLPPVLLDQYEAAATELVDELFARSVGDPARAAVLPCEGVDDVCVRRVLESFTARAFRRPVEAAEIERLMVLKAKAEELGLPAEEGLRAALRAVLLSPHFLFRVERSAVGDVSAQAVSQFELATRLSYFLWSSMPDPDLVAVAAAGTLTSTLSEQVRRMLDDEKAHEFAVNFAGQWLNVRHFEEFEPPSQIVFPQYDNELRDAAKQETLAFFEGLYDEARPLTELLTADYTIANARLAEHYGLTVGGDGFQRVSLAEIPRRGFLTQASFLISSSHPGSTSPPRRGKMVLERFMCLSIPPPPPGVEVELPTPEPGMTRSEQLALHSSNPDCRACHQLMDPIGFGFENFDAIGAYRIEENGGTIDSAGILPTTGGDVAFSSPVELAGLLAGDARFSACVTEKLLTYGVGRTFADREARAYTAALAQQGLAAGRTDWRSWLEHVVTSEAFTTRRGEAQ